MKKQKQKSGLFFGSVAFSGIGGYAEKMTSELLENGTALRKIKLSAVGITGECSPLDYYKVARAAKNAGVRIKSGKRKGLYFTLSRYKNRAGLYVGALVFVMMISLMKTTVLDIDVIGDAPKAQVLSILEKRGIKNGARLSSLDFSAAEQSLMLGISDCAWADVSREGFRVKAEVHKGAPTPEIETNAPRNMIASRPARIVETTVRKGALKTSVGSGVNTGDMLVSGTVFNNRDKILFVRADAEIIGEFTETREFFTPYNETIRSPDGEKRVYTSLILGDDEYPLFFGEPSAKNSLYSEETRILFGNPAIKLKSYIFTEYAEKNITRSPEAAVKALRKQKRDFEENFYKDYEITAETEKFSPEAGGIKLIVDYTLRGNIADPVEITIDS